MSTKSKSENDTKKEANEEKCFQLAVDAAHKRGGDTDKILSYLNGQNIDTRSKKDRPDLIRLCTNSKHEEVVVGIEHFCVNQIVKRAGNGYKSLGKESVAHIWEAYEKGHQELKDSGEVSDDICRKLMKNSVLLAQQANTLQYRSFLNAISSSLKKHMDNVDAYRKNVQQFAGQRRIELALLIEIETAFPQMFFNENDTIRVDETGLLPMVEDIVHMLSSIPEVAVDYIVLYLTSAAFKLHTDVIAFRTGNIKRQLQKQRVTVYKYAGIDKYGDAGIQFTCPQVIHSDQEGTYMAQYSYSIPLSEKGRRQRIFPALKTAYFAQKKGKPFVATREIQAALFATGKHIERFYGEGIDVGIVFRKSVPQGAAMERVFSEFDRLYPLPSPDIV